MQGRGHAPLPCCFFTRCRGGGTVNIDEPFRERVQHGLGIGGGDGGRLPGREPRRPVRSLRPVGCCDRGPRRTGVCWPRATGTARRGFSGRKTGRIFWSTRSLRSRIRKCRGSSPPQMGPAPLPGSASTCSHRSDRFDGRSGRPGPASAGNGWRNPAGARATPSNPAPRPRRSHHPADTGCRP